MSAFNNYPLGDQGMIDTKERDCLRSQVIEPVSRSTYLRSQESASVFLPINRTADAGGADRIMRIAGIIGRYPNVSQGEVGVLKSWFLREASEVDVDALACFPETREGFARFKRDHVDPTDWKHFAAAIIVIFGVLGGAALMSQILL